MAATRLKKPVSYALDKVLLARLDAWLQKQEFAPTKTTVIEAALAEWLDRRERRNKSGGHRWEAARVEIAASDRRNADKEAEGPL